MRDADVAMAARAVLVVERTPLALVVPKAIKAIGQKRERVSFHGKQNEGFNAIVKKKTPPPKGRGHDHDNLLYPKFVRRDNRQEQARLTS